jgi:prolyl-tRNA synthetase
MLLTDIGEDSIAICSECDYRANMEAAENIKETLWDSLNAFSNFYALAVNQPINGIDRIIFNIVELGGRDAVKRIIERKNKK